MSVLNRSTFQKMLDAAALCQVQGLDVPMLVLIYTSLDSLAWALYGHETKEVKHRFVSLCEAYVLPNSKLNCTSLELYAARCSILHSLGWESDLSKDGKARSAFYSFGTDDPTLAQIAYDHSYPGKFVAIRADELLVATKSAVTRVTNEAQQDKALAASLSMSTGKQYMSLESDASDKLYGSYLAAKEALREST